VQEKSDETKASLRMLVTRCMMDALRQHRNGGKQTVAVRHVNVEGGGRAIVGNFETGGSVNDGM
jgi:hypothetical protein